MRNEWHFFFTLNGMIFCYRKKFLLSKKEEFFPLVHMHTLWTKRTVIYLCWVDGFIKPNADKVLNILPVKWLLRCCACCCWLLLLLLLQQKTMLLDKAEAVYVWNRVVLKCSPQNVNARVSSYTQAEKMQRESTKKGERERRRKKIHTFRASASAWEHYQYMCTSDASFHKHTHTCTRAHIHGKCARESKNALFIQQQT